MAILPLGCTYVPSLVAVTGVVIKILLFANTDWYLYNFRLSLAKALQKQGYRVILLSPKGEYASLLEDAGFAWKEFHLSRHSMDPFRELGTLLRLVWLYGKEKPDLVHHFTIKCVLYGSLAAKIAGIHAVVNAITGLGFAFSKGQDRIPWLTTWAKILYKITLFRTHAIFQNPDDHNLFIQAGLLEPKDATIIRGSGVDVNYFSPQPEQKSIPLVILPARMLWDKGVGEFVEAVRLLKSKGIQARFALIGDTDAGNPSAVPSEKLEFWDKEEILEWWGWKENMLQVYKESHIVCLPSYREGVPKTLLEAAACGRPIVATDVPGCREIVRHRENGLLVPPQDSVLLSAALEELIKSPGLRAKMGKCSRNITLTKFSVAQIVSETLSVYQNLLHL